MKIGGLIVSGTRMLLAKALGQRIPFQMHIRITDQCNQRCLYCFADYPRRGTPPPSTQKLFDLLDGLACMGTIRITLTGGEPLIRDDIQDIVLKARENKLTCSLTTNGSLIDRHPGLVYDLDQITISLDGDRITHDRYRGRGSWEKAIHAIEVVRRAKKPVQLLCTISRLSKKGLADVFEIAEEYDCSVTFDLMAPFYNPDGTTMARSEAADDKTISILLDSLINRKNSRAVFNTYVLRYIQRWPVSYSTFRLFQKQLPNRFKPLTCFAGRFFGIIETNGDLLPCCRTGPEYTPVNVFKLGVEDAWKQMPLHNCAACCQVGANMFNALFAFHPSTMLDFISKQIKRGFL